MLVDDNPMVLGMLRQALTPLAEVISTSDAADALLKAICENALDICCGDGTESGVASEDFCPSLPFTP